MSRYFGALGTVQGQTGFCHVDDHRGPWSPSDPPSCWLERPLKLVWGNDGSSQQNSANSDAWNITDRFGIFQGKSKYKFISSKYVACFNLQDEFADENADRSHLWGVAATVRSGSKNTLRDYVACSDAAGEVADNQKHPPRVAGGGGLCFPCCSLSCLRAQGASIAPRGWSCRQ